MGMPFSTMLILTHPAPDTQLTPALQRDIFRLLNYHHRIHLAPLHVHICTHMHMYTHTPACTHVHTEVRVYNNLIIHNM